LQKAAVLEVVNIAKMCGTASASELAEIATSAVDINFAPGDLEEVLAAMTDVKLAGPPSKRPIDRTNIATVSLGRILRGWAGKRAGQAPSSPVSGFRCLGYWRAPAGPGRSFSKPYQSSSVTVSFRSSRRRSQQDFLNILHFGTTELWNSLAGPGHRESKLHDILSLSLVLGLRLPTEHTVKLVTSWWIVMSESEDARRAMDVNNKLMLLQFVKGELERLRKLPGDPINFIETLPPPMQFAREYPTMYLAVYKGTAQPVPPPLEIENAVHMFNLSYGCRGGRKSHSVASPQNLSLPAVPDSSQMMCRMLERVVDTLMHGQGSSADRSRSDTRIPLFFAAGSQPRRMPTLKFDSQDAAESPESPRFPGPVNEVALPTDHGLRTWAVQRLPAPFSQTTSPALQPPEQQMPLPALQPPEQQIPLALPPSVESPNVSELLDMLGERKAEVAQRKKDAKALVKAAAAAAAAPPMNDIPNAKSKASPKDSKAHKAKAKAVKPKAKAKANAAVAETDEGGESLPDTAADDADQHTGLPPKAKATAKAETKSKAGPPPKAKAKAKAKAETKSTAKTATSEHLVLGCPKCRRSPLGCGQCRNPAFTGSRGPAVPN